MENTQEVIKLTEAELSQLKQLEERNIALNNEIVRIGIAQLNLKQAQEAVDNYFKENIQLEKQIAKSLEDKYGQGSVNITSGEFIPAGLNKN